MNEASSARVLDPVTSLSDHQMRTLFHQLNNQLGIVLAHAELLEARAADAITRTRAEQVVQSMFDAMGTAKEIRRRCEGA